MLDRQLDLSIFSTEVVTMGDEDTIVLTPEEKEKILQDTPQDEKQEDEEEEKD